MNQGPHIPATTEKLRATLTPTPQTPDEMLGRQTEALDAIFTAITDQHLKKRLENTEKYHAQTTMQWAALALRIHKQCADTAKMRAAIEYMGGLNMLNAGASAPLPLQISKQKEEP